jgi:hypothetical protein
LQKELVRVATKKKCYLCGMKIIKEQFDLIKEYFPRQCGNVKIDNFTFISAILYMAENGVLA